VPQLSEGWVKRVMKKINLYDQKIKDFHTTDVDTVASMISEAGKGYAGDVALSEDPEYLKNVGIIELYETLFKKAKGFDDGTTAVDQPILFAANRLAGLYMLLGNEAYADAEDPTIGFSTDGGQMGAEASSIFCFENQVDSLLEEELALLRGRGTDGIAPVYNRLMWNFTLGDGEVAYKENYNIRDQKTVDTDNDGYPEVTDGSIDEMDAAKQYPQGHGDAWGHYLTAIKYYYYLLKDTKYTWHPMTEDIVVAGAPVTVDYRDERAFANVAAAKARTGAEIVSLTYRQKYVDNPDGQWQGYKDTDTTARGWGVSEWASRAGQGAFFDWVVGNALLPAQSAYEGIKKIDRTTVVELRDIASQSYVIQAEVDKADAGLNPLGLAKNAVPFDIDPTKVANGETHFEQIYSRAMDAMNNAIMVFNNANQSTNMLRKEQDSLEDFKRTIENTEADYNNRLIEVFGYPYPEDCGPGKTYDSSYAQTGPDLYHYMYADSPEGIGFLNTKTFPINFKDIKIDSTGALNESEKTVLFTVATDDSRMRFVKPSEWTGRRKAPGEVQLAKSDLLQAWDRFVKARAEYANLVDNIEDQAKLFALQIGVNFNEIYILNTTKNQQIDLNSSIMAARESEMLFATMGRIVTITADALAEFFPKELGLSNDVTSTARGALKLEASIMNEMYSGMSNLAQLSELGAQQAKEIVSAESNIKITILKDDFALQQQRVALENQIRSEVLSRLELFTLAEALWQTGQRYLSALAKGQRLLEDQLRFRRQTAAKIQDFRYQDMTFRIFRNDALQKYRAQFDMAAQYVYLAAKAYDYETTLLDQDTKAGQAFLTDIVKQQTIGAIQNGQPLTGSGLADTMKRMSQNFQVLKPQLGFNNPQAETNRFSLRQELFRIRMDSGSNENWRNTLTKYSVPDLWNVPEFRHYCRPFADEGIPEPGIVIPFDTTVTAGLNFFAWPLGGGDAYYSATNFATKVRSVGVWFSNYNSVGLSQTPRIYLVPVGEDILRTPASTPSDIRTWQIVDEKIPAPFPIVPQDLKNNPGWIPSVNTINDEMFQIRQSSDFRAYHDSGYFTESEMAFDTRLIGRSVWNNRWLLIIPGQNLLSDPQEGLDTFIYGPIGANGQRTGNGISDIKLFFQTYAYSGN
jgi:hypothetical protein